MVSTLMVAAEKTDRNAIIKAMYTFFRRQNNRGSFPAGAAAKYVR